MSVDRLNNCKEVVEMFVNQMAYLYIADHALSTRRDGFIPPKKPYSFEAMMDDILDFAAFTLVDNARLALWMPTANDDDVKLALPTHPYLELLSSCKQPFNKCMLFLEYNGPNFGKEIVITFTINILTRKSGSRQLLTFRRMSDANLPASAVLEWKRRAYGTGSDANELNTFRRKVSIVYFTA